MSFRFRTPQPSVFQDSKKEGTAQFRFKEKTFTTDNSTLHTHSVEGEEVIVELGPLPRGYQGRQVSPASDARSPGVRVIADVQEGRLNYSAKPMPSVVATTLLVK